MRDFVLIESYSYPFDDNNVVRFEHRIDMNFINTYKPFGNVKVKYYGIHFTKNDGREFDLYYKTKEERDEYLDFLDNHLGCLKMIDVETYQTS